MFRKIGNPDSIFLVLGKALVEKSLINYSPIEFQVLRIEAEKQAKRENAFFSLVDIYRHFNCLCPSKKNTLSSILKQELLLEKQICTHNPDILNKINIERNRGHQIAHLSDMYLPKSFIEGLLIENGIMEKSDLLYVSNHDKSAKGDGSMFRKISADHDIPLNRISHIGNCYHADYLGAKRAGVETTHYFSGNSTKKEKKLDEIACFTEGISSYWSGISRIGRLSYNKWPSKNNEYYCLDEIACSVASPILCTYVHWVLEQALEDNVNKLFFIARDGQILFKIAQLLREESINYQKIKLYYLYGSREAWRPASISEIDRFSLNWILGDPLTLTPNKIYQRICLVERKLHKEKNNPLKNFNFNDIIPLELHHDIKTWLKSPMISQFIIKSSKEKRNTLIKYFKQEGVFDESVGIVEIGCTGITQHAVHKMLNTLNLPRHRNYFFGLTDGDLNTSDFKSKSFFYDQKSEYGISPSPDYNFFVLLETFCMSDHGRTLTYSEKNGKITPVLADKAKFFKDEKWELFFSEKILSTAKAYAKSGLQLPKSNICLIITTHIIRNFWQKPSIMEARIWSSHIKEHDPTSGQTETLSKPYSIMDVFNNLLGVGLNATWWEIARIKMSNQFILSLISISHKVGRFFVAVRIHFGRWKNFILYRVLPKI